MTDLYKKYVKLYKITFNTYTNALNDTVHHNNNTIDFIHIPETGLIVREDELDTYKEYGNGFASLTIVGEMLV